MMSQFTLVVSCLIVTVVNALPQGQGDYRNFAPALAKGPVPILSQIDTHNEDGSYTYGYEGGDGTYKIETKNVNGDVKGKYGYYDDQGKLREIEYGATNMGFVPMGTDIAPPSPPIQQRTQGQGRRFQQPLQNGGSQTTEPEDDGTYRPAEYETPYQYQPVLPKHQRQQQLQPYQHLQQYQQQFPVSRQERQRQKQVMRQLQQQHQQFNPDNLGRQTYNPQEQFNFVPDVLTQNQNTFQGHPATNINLNSGTYSIAY